MKKFVSAMLTLFLVLSGTAQARKRIAFVSLRDGNKEIYIMDGNGENVRRLTNNRASDDAPSWSPNGQEIAFVSNRDGNKEIYVMDANGKNPVILLAF